MNSFVTEKLSIYCSRAGNLNNSVMTDLGDSDSDLGLVVLHCVQLWSVGIKNDMLGFGLFIVT
jgi:hypothetical protein